MLLGLPWREWRGGLRRKRVCEPQLWPGPLPVPAGQPVPARRLALRRRPRLSGRQRRDQLHRRRPLSGRRTCQLAEIPAVQVKSGQNICFLPVWITTYVELIYISLVELGCNQRLNMEVDLQSLLGLHVTWCAQLYSLAETPQPPPPPIPPHWDSYTRALLVRKDRRHLCVTPLL